MNHTISRIFLISGVLQAAGALWSSALAAAQESAPFEKTLSGENGSWQRVELQIPAGATQLQVKLSGGTGDADLYLRPSDQPTLTEYSCRPWIDGNDENCDAAQPQAGTWHIGVFAYTAFEGVTLKATWTAPKAEPQPPATGGLADWQKQTLDEHNVLRAKHCAPELTWNATLAAEAQAWAERCDFAHSSGPYGENLSAGTSRTAIEAVDDWYSEIANYNFAAPGTSANTGHFSQLVWRDSTQLGCGMARCSNIFPEFGGAFFYVCRYQAQGNMAGGYEQNVKPVSDGGLCE